MSPLWMLIMVGWLLLLLLHGRREGSCMLHQGLKRRIVAAKVGIQLRQLMLKLLLQLLLQLKLLLLHCRGVLRADFVAQQSEEEEIGDLWRNLTGRHRRRQPLQLLREIARRRCRRRRRRRHERQGPPWASGERLRPGGWQEKRLLLVVVVVGAVVVVVGGGVVAVSHIPVRTAMSIRRR